MDGKEDNHTTGAPRSAPALDISGLSKSFSGVPVLTDVALRVERGEIHGLIGQNGSGKSTLIKVLAGYHEPDPGAATLVDGERVRGRIDASRGASLGIAFIHQDLALIPSASILDNVRIQHFTTGLGGRIRWSQERRTVAGYLTAVGLGASPGVKVGELSVTEQALVAIARGLSDLDALRANHSGGLLVLDEPTAYLPRDGVERLFKSLRGLAARGTSVLLVSHRLDEILEVTDRVSVLRDGRLVDTVTTTDTTQARLIELMLGQPLGSLYPDHADGAAERAMNVEGLRGILIKELSFAIRPGEIIGFTGLPGMGSEELPYLLGGAVRPRSGRLSVGGRTIDLARLTPRAAIRAGIHLLPADRQARGGALALSVQENLSIPFLQQHSVRGVLRSRREAQQVASVLRQYQVRPSDPARTLGTLSGGNQQKALIGKWLQTRPELFVLHEPTQGVDIGSKKEIFAQLAQLAAAGTGTVVASVEHEDLAHICDRVYVMRGGRVHRELRGSQLTTGRLLEAVYGTA
jgi:ribose transport system ATP-binding protein